MCRSVGEKAATEVNFPRSHLHRLDHHGRDGRLNEGAADDGSPVQRHRCGAGGRGEEGGVLRVAALFQGVDEGSQRRVPGADGRTDLDRGRDDPGAAAGTVGVHFNLCPGPIEFAKDGTLRTLFDDGNNIRIKSKGCKSVRIQQEEGWVSNAYRKKEERPAYAVEMPKETGEEIWIVSVIAPEDKERKGSIAIVPDPANTGDRFRAALRVGGKTYDLKYDL